MNMYEFDGELFEDVEELMMHLGAWPTAEPTSKACPVCGSSHFDVEGKPYESILLSDGESLCDNEDCLLEYYDVKIVEVEEVDLNEELNREFNKERL